MNKDWSAKNKEIQGLLSKESTFGEAIEKLIEFRDEMFRQITWIIEGYPEKAFYVTIVSLNNERFQKETFW
jgi:hypothetical protein